MGNWMLLARQDVRLFFRDWSALLWLFVMPPMFIFFIGNMTAGFASSDEQRDAVAVHWQGEPGVVEQWLERRLSDEFEVYAFDAQGEPLGHEANSPEQFRRLIRVPADAGARAMAGEQVKLVFEKRSEALAGQFDELRLKRAVYLTLADLVLALENDELSLEALRAQADSPRALSMKVTSAGSLTLPPSGFAQAVPGILVFFVLIMLLATGGSALVNERHRGQLRRLASAPMSRMEVVAGKSAARLVLAVVQIGFVMLAGWLLFGYDWTPNLAMVLLVLLAWGAVCTAAAMLLGSVASSEGQAIAVGVIGGNIMGALGGCWWPIEIAPEWMQSIQSLLPTGWTMNALHKLLSFGHGPEAVVGELLLLSGLALLLMGFAARRFRFL